MFEGLLRGRFNGPVYPVHPTARSVASVRAYPTVLDVPDAVDLAVIAVPASAVPGVVEECAAKGVRALVVLSAGFAETGETGRGLPRSFLSGACLFSKTSIMCWIGVMPAIGSFENW